MNACRLLTVMIASLLFGTAFAQTPEAWPTKSITMVVPFPPGGVADAVGRPVAEALSRILGQPVVVENKAGGSGTIGANFVAKAPSDGMTILMSATAEVVINQHFNRHKKADHEPSHRP